MNKIKINITKIISFFKQIDYKTWQFKDVLKLLLILGLTILFFKLLSINIYLIIIMLGLTLLYHKIFDKYIDNQNIFIRYIIYVIALNILSAISLILFVVLDTNL